MMMNEAVQHRCVQDAMTDFAKLIKLTEDGSTGQARAQEIAKIHESHWRQDKRNPQQTKQSVRGPISRRRSRRIRRGDPLSPPSLFT